MSKLGTLVTTAHRAYVLFGLAVEVFPDEERAHGHAEVAVDVGDAELPPGGHLLPPVQQPVQLVLDPLKPKYIYFASKFLQKYFVVDFFLSPFIQIVNSVADESHENVVCQNPLLCRLYNLGELLEVFRCVDDNVIFRADFAGDHSVQILREVEVGDQSR